MNSHMDLEAVIWGGLDKVPPYFKMTQEERADFEQHMSNKLNVEEMDAMAQEQAERDRENMEEWKDEPEVYKEDGEVYDHERDMRTAEIRDLNSREEK